MSSRSSNLSSRIIVHSVRGFASGRVQGVGFRYFVRRCAEARAVSGYAVNLPDGRVEFLLQGDAGAVEWVIEQIRLGPRHARVDAVSLDDPDDLDARDGFVTR